MSNYDTLPRGSQVKCWGCEGNTYQVGDEVLWLFPEYVVLLAEGGYVKVKEGKITKIVENKRRKAYYPEDFDIPCIDKWARQVMSRADMEHSNIMGGKYYWWEEADG